VTRENPNATPYVVSRRRTGKLVLAALVTVVVAAVVWAAAIDRRAGADSRSAGLNTEGGIPTSGSGGDAGTGGDQGPPAVVPPRAIQRLSALSRGDNLESLIGRQLDLEVTINDPNDVAFWADEDGRRALVVLKRDTRTDAQRQNGEPPTHHIEPLRGGDRVRITGTVDRLPHAEAMYSWNLSTRDAAELRRSYAYIRADRVTVEPPAQ